MEKNEINTIIGIPKGFILFISGVPGVGKTTISYELLKRFHDFRIIEETDILRDALRGYNEMLIDRYGQKIRSILNDTEIYDHTRLLSFAEAKQQCIIIKNSIENIVARQQRKGIPSIINGVHIIPEILKDLAYNPYIHFINLYVSNEAILSQRLTNRDPESYMLEHIPFIYRSNNDLYTSTKNLAASPKKSFYNIDVAFLNIDDTLAKITESIQAKLQDI
jgi:2-phosphoglycerate kinase